jgi:hypothetical protein
MGNVNKDPFGMITGNQNSCLVFLVLLYTSRHNMFNGLIFYDSDYGFNWFSQTEVTFTKWNPIFVSGSLTK